MTKNKFYALLCATCLISALVGISLGYFVFGPMSVSAREDTPPDTAILRKYTLTASAHAEPTEEPAQGYILTVSNGYVAVYYLNGKNAGALKEVTRTHLDSLPEEEQIRLIRGIRVSTEEALFRLLEDYGS